MKKQLLPLILLAFFACKDTKNAPPEMLIKEMNLKRGDVISCGPADKEFGSLTFDVSGNERIKEDFHLGLKLLHSFEYEEAEKVFAKIIDTEPGCAMAYWGIAMSNFHPLWTPPTEDELRKGTKALHIARSIKQKTEREAAYIDALASFYDNWEKVDHRSRCASFEKAMENLYTQFPEDKETAIFYALALNAAAEPSDKTYSKQTKAGDILNALYPGQPNHPGIIHYLIHTYDFPELAERALPAARKYATVAPSSAHALHMPSHIFTRLGLWNESIKSNLASVSSAQCYAQSAGIKGHWEEELHGMDYLVYAYLQKGNNKEARKQWDYLNSMKNIHPLNFKVAYAFAAIPSRFLMENRHWKEAAALPISSEIVPWQNFPWQKSILHFTRLMGNMHTGAVNAAKEELSTLTQLHALLLKQKDMYKATQVEIQINMGKAWIKFKEGKNNEALALMTLAADMEDRTEKHPVTPGEVIPARELLGDMLMQMKLWEKALEAYEMNLKKHPNRFNGLYNAGLASERLGDTNKAKAYYQKLLESTDSLESDRPEIKSIQEFMKVNEGAKFQTAYIN